MGPELLEGADPVSAAMWRALFEAVRLGREVLRGLYGPQEGPSGPDRPRLASLAEDLGVELMNATRGTPAFISRDAERQHSRSRPVPSRWSRRDFQDAARVFKVLAEILHETGPEALQEWAKPIHPPASLAPLRAQLATALAACEAPTLPYTKKIRQQKAMEKLGMPLSGKW